MTGKMPEVDGAHQEAVKSFTCMHVGIFLLRIKESRGSANAIVCQADLSHQFGKSFEYLFEGWLERVMEEGVNCLEGT